MGFFKKLGKALLDNMVESRYKRHVVQRPFYCTEVRLSDVKPGLVERIGSMSLVIKAETREGWKEVGLVRALSDTQISYSPHVENYYNITCVEITRNHTGKIVARAQGHWIDSGMGI